MTWHEYTALIHAYHLKEVDREYELHKVAFYNQMVKGMKGAGKNQKPVYPTLKDFFDYEKALKAIEQPDLIRQEIKQNDRLAKIALSFNEGGETNGQ